MKLESQKDLKLLDKYLGPNIHPVNEGKRDEKYSY